MKPAFKGSDNKRHIGSWLKNNESTTNGKAQAPQQRIKTGVSSLKPVQLKNRFDYHTSSIIDQLATSDGAAESNCANYETALGMKNISCLSELESKVQFPAQSSGKQTQMSVVNHSKLSNQGQKQLMGLAHKN